MKYRIIETNEGQTWLFFFIDDKAALGYAGERTFNTNAVLDFIQQAEQVGDPESAHDHLIKQTYFNHPVIGEG